MNPVDKKTLTIARRTRKNLDYIYEQKKRGADVEEFTQLLNSILGMLILPREEYFNSHFRSGNEVTWQNLEEMGLERLDITEKQLCTESPNLKPAESFSQLITNMRHAFAHHRFEIIGETEIKSVKVWDVPSREKNETKDRRWEAEFSIEQLKSIAYLFIDYLEKKHGHEAGNN